MLQGMQLERTKRGGPDSESSYLYAGQVLHFTGAVTERLHGNPKLVEHSQVKVGHRRFLRIPEMPPPLYTSGGAANQENRQIVMIVPVSIAHAAPVHDHDVVQKRAVAIRGRCQFIQIV